MLVVVFARDTLGDNPRAAPFIHDNRYDGRWSVSILDRGVIVHSDSTVRVTGAQGHLTRRQKLVPFPARTGCQLKQAQCRDFWNHPFNVYCRDTPLPLGPLARLKLRAGAHLQHAKRGVGTWYISPRRRHDGISETPLNYTRWPFMRLHCARSQRVSHWLMCRGLLVKHSCILWHAASKQKCLETSNLKKSYDEILGGTKYIGGAADTIYAFTLATCCTLKL